MWPSGKAPGFGPGIRGFESLHPSQNWTRLKVVTRKGDQLFKSPKMAHFFDFAQTHFNTKNDNSSDQPHF